MQYYTERWYHVYMYLIMCTSALAVVTAAFSEWSTTPFIMAYGIMGIFSSICFLAESMVMGFTAKAGGFFWTAVTCFLVAHYLPFPG